MDAESVEMKQEVPTTSAMKSDESWTPRDTQNSGTNFGDVPAEIKTMIFTYLDGKTCFELSLCSKSLYHLSQENSRIMPKRIIPELRILEDAAGDFEMRIVGHRYSRLFTFTNSRRTTISPAIIVKLLNVRYDNSTIRVRRWWKYSQISIKGKIKENIKAFMSFIIGKAQISHLVLHSQWDLEQHVLEPFIYSSNAHGRKIYHKFDKVSVKTSYKIDVPMLIQFDAKKLHAEMSYSSMRLTSSILPTPCFKLRESEEVVTPNMIEKIIDRFPKYHRIEMTGVSTLSVHDAVEIFKKRIDDYKNKTFCCQSYIQLPLHEHFSDDGPEAALKTAFGDPTVVNIESDVDTHDDSMISDDDDILDDVEYCWNLPECHMHVTVHTNFDYFVDNDSWISAIFVPNSE